MSTINQPRPVRALLFREVRSAFTTPTAYIFITLFVFLCGVAAFWTPAFFARNLANMDQLNARLPLLLLLLVPAITMGAWAEERKTGTDELLLTLPAPEWKLALGKYLGCVSVFGVCLLFAACHVLVLVYLGRPDVGLLAATYAGYLLAGAGLIGVGLLASAVSPSATIAYITGAVLCLLLVAMGWAGPVLPGGAGGVSGLGAAVVSMSVPARLESFGRGVIDLGDVAYFVGMGALGVVLTAGLLARRRRVGQQGAGAALHTAVRLVSLVVAAVSIVTLAGRAGVRADATAERLWTLSPATRAILAQIPAGEPVALTMYVSPEVPPSLVQQRESLLGIAREMAAASGGKVTVITVPAEPNTAQARDADRAFGIKPRAVPAEDERIGGVREVFLSVAATSAGGEVATVPFLSRGLSVEYELARAIRSATTASRKTVGVLETPAGLFGSFDFQTMSPRPDWPIVAELRKQYKVERVAAGVAVPESIDVLLVAQPSALTTEQLTAVVAWVSSGKPTLIFEDPLPLINPALATAEPRQQRSQFEQNPGPKADLAPLWNALGAKVSGEVVVWDSFNPRPAFAQTAGEFIWATARKNIGFDPFNQQSTITAGLQEVVLLFGGRIDRLEPGTAASEGTPASGPAATEFKTLIRSGPTSGSVPYNTILTRSFFGGPSLNPNRKPTRVGSSQSMVAHLTGGPGKVNAVLVADLDMISETFFAMRENGAAEMEFDNVPLVLSAVDALAGDTSLVELRKKRRVYRTLERIDARRQVEAEEALRAQERAQAEAEARLTEAQARVDQRVKEVSDRADLDEQSKAIMAASVQNAEQSRLTAQTAAIEQQRASAVADAQLQSRANIARIESGVRIAAVTLPPVPALVTGLVVMIGRRRAAQSPRRS